MGEAAQASRVPVGPEIVLRLTVASGLWLTVSTHTVPAGRCGSPALKAQQAILLCSPTQAPVVITDVESQAPGQQNKTQEEGFGPGCP